MFTLAHANESHESAVEGVAHVLGPWYVAFPILLAVIAAIGYITFLVSNKNMGSVILVEAFTLLVIGFATATTYPLISVAAITIGVLLSGFMAFAGLAAGK